MQNNFETIEFSLESKIAHLRLNRPEQQNALNRELVQELTRFFREADSNDEIMVVILSGNGKSFCSGADLLWMKNSVNLSEDVNHSETLELSEMFEAIYQCSKVVIGMAHGSIYGGGNGLLAACDLAYCTHDSRFSLSETRIGLVAATISPYLLRRIPPAVVKELVFTAFRFDGQRAQETGMVNRTFATRDEMGKYVDEVIDAILQGGPQSVLASKQLINQLSDYRFPDGINEEMAQMLASTRISKEAQEGMTAFVEKRKPLWK
jgi:methylglutaconyl-CoA hydratase